jgi:hypothetical protein
MKKFLGSITRWEKSLPIWFSVVEGLLLGVVLGGACVAIIILGGLQ